mmetsp:Transcript_76802/g.135646  ORF Transcript_76802/g.135646 Transcript_76802/m.135646 type:complete len:83 (+) Transcript_76802:120-368(+)
MIVPIVLPGIKYLQWCCFPFHFRITGSVISTISVITSNVVCRGLGSAHVAIAKVMHWTCRHQLPITPAQPLFGDQGWGKGEQ